MYEEHTPSEAEVVPTEQSVDAVFGRYMDASLTETLAPIRSIFTHTDDPTIISATLQLLRTLAERSPDSSQQAEMLWDLWDILGSMVNRDAADPLWHRDIREAIRKVWAHGSLPQRINLSALIAERPKNPLETLEDRSGKPHMGRPAVFCVNCGRIVSPSSLRSSRSHENPYSGWQVKYHCKNVDPPDLVWTSWEHLVAMREPILRLASECQS